MYTTLIILPQKLVSFQKYSEQCRDVLPYLLQLIKVKLGQDHLKFKKIVETSFGQFVLAAVTHVSFIRLKHHRGKISRRSGTLRL